MGTMPIYLLEEENMRLWLVDFIVLPAQALRIIQSVCSLYSWGPGSGMARYPPV